MSYILPTYAMNNLEEESEEEYLDDPIQLIDAEQRRFGDYDWSIQKDGKSNPETTCLTKIDLTSDSEAADHKVHLTHQETFNNDKKLRHQKEFRTSNVKVVDYDKHQWYYSKINKSLSDKTARFRDLILIDYGIDITTESDTMIVKTSIQPVADRPRICPVDITTYVGNKTKVTEKEPEITTEGKKETPDKQELNKIFPRVTQVDLRKNQGLVGMKIVYKTNSDKMLLQNNTKSVKSKRTSKKNEKECSELTDKKEIERKEDKKKEVSAHEFEKRNKLIKMLSKIKKANKVKKTRDTKPNIFEKDNTTCSPLLESSNDQSISQPKNGKNNKVNDKWKDNKKNILDSKTTQGSKAEKASNIFDPVSYEEIKKDKHNKISDKLSTIKIPTNKTPKEKEKKDNDTKEDYTKSKSKDKINETCKVKTKESKANDSNMESVSKSSALSNSNKDADKCKNLTDPTINKPQKVFETKKSFIEKPMSIASTYATVGLQQKLTPRTNTCNNQPAHAKLNIHENITLKPPRPVNNPNLKYCAPASINVVAGPVDARRNMTNNDEQTTMPSVKTNAQLHSSNNLIGHPQTTSQRYPPSHTSRTLLLPTPGNNSIPMNATMPCENTNAQPNPSNNFTGHPQTTSQRYPSTHTSRTPLHTTPGNKSIPMNATMPCENTNAQPNPSNNYTGHPQTTSQRYPSTHTLRTPLHSTPGNKSIPMKATMPCVNTNAQLRPSNNLTGHPKNEIAIDRIVEMRNFDHNAMSSNITRPGENMIMSNERNKKVQNWSLQHAHPQQIETFITNRKRIAVHTQSNPRVERNVSQIVPINGQPHSKNILCSPIYDTNIREYDMSIRENGLSYYNNYQADYPQAHWNYGYQRPPPVLVPPPPPPPPPPATNQFLNKQIPHQANKMYNTQGSVIGMDDSGALVRTISITSTPKPPQTLPPKEIARPVENMCNRPAYTRSEMFEELNKAVLNEFAEPDHPEILKANTDGNMQNRQLLVRCSKPGPLSKKPKLDIRANNNSNAAPQTPRAGYSPPILPIPTYIKTIEFLTKASMARDQVHHASQMNYIDQINHVKPPNSASTNNNLLLMNTMTLPITNISRGEAPRNSQYCTSSKELVYTSNDKEDQTKCAKKISLHDYKKRLSTDPTLAPDASAQRHIEPTMGQNGPGELLVPKSEIKTEHDDTEGQTDLDLGYDSDSTIKL